MKHPYKNRSGDSGILNYETVNLTTLILEFTASKYRYIYNEVTPGVGHVREMIRLALKGEGLSTYINQHVREHYASRLPLP